MKLIWFAVCTFCVLHFSTAGNTANAPKNSDEPKDALEGGVDYAIKNSIVPAHVRQALAIGKAVYEKYLRDSGDSTDENEEALESVIGSEAGRGLSLDTVKNAIGNAWELVITSPLITQNNKNALAAGRAAYERFLERTAPDSDKSIPVFSAEDLKNVLDGSVNYAIGSPVVPVPAKGVLATGKALKKGWQTFRETGNLTEVKMAIFGSSLESVDDIARTSPSVALAKAGTGLAKDFYQGKDIKSAVTDRGQDVLVSFGGGVVEVAINVVKKLKSGELLDAIKRGKEALKLGTKVNESEPVEIELIEMQPIERKTNENDTVAAVDEPNVEVTNL